MQLMGVRGLGLNCSGATPDMGCPGNPVMLPGQTTVDVLPDGSGTITDNAGNVYHMPAPTNTTTYLLIAAVGLVGLMLLTRR